MIKENLLIAARSVFAGLALGLLLCFSTYSANAATITVNTLVDEAGVGADCSLREAITAANNNTAFGGCPAGSGTTDTVVFNVTGTIQLTSQLPGIASSMSIVNASGPGGLTIRRNTAADYQIFLVLAGPSVVSISGLTISNGHAPAGGAIQNGAQLTVSDCIITGNTATLFAGGGIYNVGSLAVINTTISGNTATPVSGNGGAGIENSGRLSVTNSTVSGNRVAVAAGSSCAGGISSGSSLPVTITNSTIADNEAYGATCAAGVRRNSGTITIGNSIIAGNRNNTVTPDVNGVFVSSGSNLIGSALGTGFSNGVNGDHVGTLLSPIGPILGTLQDNGGSTPTHALLTGSPAIDAGNNSLAVDPATSLPLNEDQRGTGFARIVNNKVDIGSYEVQEIPNSAPTILAKPVSVRQGAGPSNVKIATVSDKEDLPGALLVTVDGSSSASTNSVTISNLVVDSSGNVTADVGGACSASNASFVLRVTDSGGLYSEASLAVAVTPSRAPVITLNPFMTMFPPNHKYTAVSVGQMVNSVSDDCDANLLGAVTVEKVTSDELDDAAGDSDGSTTQDMMIAPDASGVLLRVERDDNLNGRVYTVTVKVTDSSGNTTRADFNVFVPMGRKGAAIEDPVASIVSG